MKREFNRSVFVNCPFDTEYLPIFRATIFCIFDCGFIARCALEIQDGSDIRIEKIFRIISECKYGIHDISRTELDVKRGLPRFNMPLELGMFLGAKRFGDKIQHSKNCLILDCDPYRYHIFISDIAGQDIQSHQNQDTFVIRVIRDWLRAAEKKICIPGGDEINRRYLHFKTELPPLCDKLKIGLNEMTFNDYTAIVYEWLALNP